MPWNIVKKDRKYCVAKEDGEVLKCYPTKKAAEEYRTALYANADEALEQTEAIMLENNGPVILGVAMTNIPHLPLPPMSIWADEEGKEYVRVPFLRKGIFRHQSGPLVFNDTVFKKMLDNFESGKSHYGVSLNLRHDPKLGALAWFDKARGGWIQKESDPDFGEVLVGYGNPTSQTAIDYVKNKQYVFASAEFHPKHEDTLLTKLSWDDLEEIQKEDLVKLEVTEVTEEEEMEEVTISLEEYKGLQEKGDKLAQAEARIAELEVKITALETQETPEVELPEAARVQLEQARAEIEQLKRGALQTHVELTLNKAENYRDENGRGHSPVLLEVARKALLGQQVDATGEVIKLESNQASDVGDYYRKVIVYLLENLPGQVQFEGKTEPDDKREVVLESGQKFTEEDYKSLWSDVVLG